jgi:Cytochrome c
MVAAFVFVLLFVVLGLGVVLVAMTSRSGPRKPPSRAARRALVIGLPILIVVIGIGVPAIVIAGNHHSHADVGPGGLALSNNTTIGTDHVDQVAGRLSFSEHCATCHTLSGANAVGKVGPNLDLLVGGLGPSNIQGTKLKYAFVMSTIHDGRARGAGQMPAQLVIGQDAKNVAAFVAAVAGH